MSWGASNRNRKHCFLLMCILCLQPRRPTLECLLGSTLFHKESQGWTQLTRNLPSPKLQPELGCLERIHHFPQGNREVIPSPGQLQRTLNGSQMTPWKVARSSQAGFSVEQDKLPCALSSSLYPSILLTGPGVGGVGGEDQSGMYAHVGRQSFIPEACAFRPVFHVCFLCTCFVPRQSVPFFKAVVLYLSNAVTL